MCLPFLWQERSKVVLVLSPNLGDCLAMSHSVTVRPKQRPTKPQNLIYSFPSASTWMQ